MTEENVIIPKKPLAITLFAVLLLFVPLAGFFAHSVKFGILVGDTTFQIFLHPLYSVFVGVYVLLFLYIYLSKSKIVNEYDGTEEKKIAANKAAKKLISLLIIFPFLSGFVNWFVIMQIAKLLGITVYAVPILFSSLGSLFLLGLFVYILFLQNFERWTGLFLPLLPEYRSLPAVIRNILVSCFSLLGVIFLVLSPLFLPHENITFTEFFMQNSFESLIIGVILAIADSYLIASGTAHRLQRIKDFTAELSNCNYTQDELILESRDEFGLLVNDLNSFFSITKGLLHRFQDTTKESAVVAASLSATISGAAVTLEEINANINSVKEQVVNQSAGVEETHATVLQIMNGIEKLDENIESQAASVTQSSASIEEMVANIRSVTDILNKNAIAVQDLGMASEVGLNKVQEAVEISSKIMEESTGLLEASSVIQNIASQTNLLAMNAAIEAAHAGDVGKGFAVVSDEIRKLAEESNAQGKSITERMHRLEESITAVFSSTQEVQNQFDVIFELSKIVKNQEDVIMSAMKEQSAGSIEILQAVQQINVITGIVRDGSTQMLRGGKEIVTEMDILADATRLINDAMIEMGTGANQVSEVAQISSNMTRENTRTIGELEEDIKQFKL